MTGLIRWTVRVSEPWLAILRITNILAPLERVMTAITEATPIMTPIMVRMVRILFAQSDWSATLIASRNCMDRDFPWCPAHARIGFDCQAVLVPVYAIPRGGVPFFAASDDRGDVLLAVPGDGAAQSLLERNRGLIAESFAGSRDIGQGIGNVACARRPIDRRFFEIKQIGHDAVGLVQRVTLAAGDIEDASGDLLGRGFHGEEVGRYGILDVGEVAALLAVAVDGG